MPAVSPEMNAWRACLRVSIRRKPRANAEPLDRARETARANAAERDRGDRKPIASTKPRGSILIVFVLERLLRLGISSSQKPVLMGEGGRPAKVGNPRHGGVGRADEILKLAAPRFMPFITEELWAVTSADCRGGLLSAPLRPRGGGSPPQGGERDRTLLALTSLGPHSKGLTDGCGRGRDRLGRRSRDRDTLGARGK